MLLSVLTLALIRQITSTPLGSYASVLLHHCIGRGNEGLNSVSCESDQPVYH